MNASEVERWALEVLDRVQRSGAQEDDRVEFKRDAIDPTKLARRLAGHANAARAEWILWIFGVDEKEGFVGTSSLEWSSLWPQVFNYPHANRAFLSNEAKFPGARRVTLDHFVTVRIHARQPPHLEVVT
jgi:hypothetical protein